MRTISVSAPAQPVALALRESLKADLGITDDSQDSRLDDLLLDASGLVLDYIGRPILDSTWRDVIKIRGDEQRLSLMLGVYPVTKIMAFVPQGGAPLSPEQIAGLDLMADSGIIYPPASGSVVWSPGQYVVTYQAGYTAPSRDKDGTPQSGTLPRAISSAVLLAAKASWHAAYRDPLLRSESEQGTGSSSWSATAAGSGGLPQSAADMLASYRSGGLR